ncbi:MAG: alpha/beta fold hydrolase [Planctomycetaceae bacterium]|nr:alpha/beta fold hydrolase [Planctomycetaceae bacterium]
MVHGNPTWSFYWRRLIRHYSQHFRVIAIDHLGCGWSDKPQNASYLLDTHIRNLSALNEQLQLEQITLFAHDWGGAIGMGAAAREPQKFSRFVLFNTAAFRSRRIPLRIAVCRIPLLGTLAVRGLNLFARAAVHMAVEHHERMTPAVRRGLLAPYGNWHDRIAVHRFVQDIPLKPSHPSWQTLVEVEDGLAQFQHSPVLLVWGEQDWCFSPHFRREFEQRLPQAESFPIQNAGHYVVEDAHEIFLPRIDQFLKEHPLPALP